MIENIVHLAGTESPANSSAPLPFGEAMSLGWSVTLIGVLIVFAALVCLIFITWLYPKISLALLAKSTVFKAERLVKKSAKQAAKTAGDSKPKETSVQRLPAKENATDDPEIIAVITAAIAAAMGTSSNGIIIKSLRRSSANVSSWSREARNEQVYNRF